VDRGLSKKDDTGGAFYRKHWDWVGQWRVAECRFEGEPKRLELRLEHVPRGTFPVPGLQKLRVESTTPSKDAGGI